jgi:hypothetical protein
MKTFRVALALLLLSLLGCSTQKAVATKKTKKSSPETVIVNYNVQPGNEAALEQVLVRAWKTYQAENLVLSKPHIIVRDHEKDGRARYVEIFTWVSHEAADQAPASVKSLWNEMIGLCESRNGHGPLEGGEVEIFSSAR